MQPATNTLRRKGKKRDEEYQTLQDMISSLSSEERAQLARLLTPRMADAYVPHVPHPPQQVFLNIDAREVLFGGAAGGGKSDSLLMAALQYVDVPGYNALILRRTYADLVLPGAIMDRASSWLRPTDAKPKAGGVTWVFPSGARLTFGYLQNSNDKFRYASAEFQFIGFDELTQFKEDDYTFLFSRLRKPTLACVICRNKIRRSSAGTWTHSRDDLAKKRGCPYVVPDHAALEEYRPSQKDGLRLFDVPLRMRSASNPGGPGHLWVRDRFVNKLTKPKSTLFVPSSLDDNPSLDRAEYRKSLSHLSPLDRERLLNGDWDVLEQGNMFQREWWRSCNERDIPTHAKWARFWDLAASTDGDFTVGALCAYADGDLYVVDIVRKQMTPHEVEQQVRRTADIDRIKYNEKVRIYIEQEPGSSGKSLMDHYRRNVLAGYYVKPIRSSTSKELRATPLSSAAEAGMVKLVLAEWNRQFMDEASFFPNSEYDDQVDAVSGAHTQLSRGASSRIVV